MQLAIDFSIYKNFLLASKSVTQIILVYTWLFFVNCVLPIVNYIFSAILNFALRALLFSVISESLGTIGLRVMALKGVSWFPKKSFSTSPSNFPLRMMFFTNLSSKD